MASNTPILEKTGSCIKKCDLIARKSLNKSDRDKVLWARETEHFTQILVFTKTAGRHNLVEVVVILKVFLTALAANLKYNKPGGRSADDQVDLTPEDIARASFREEEIEKTDRCSAKVLVNVPLYKSKW